MGDDIYPDGVRRAVKPGSESCYTNKHHLHTPGSETKLGKLLCRRPSSPACRTTSSIRAKNQDASGVLLLFSRNEDNKEENSIHTKGVAFILSKTAQGALNEWEAQGPSS